MCRAVGWKSMYEGARTYFVLTQAICTSHRRCQLREQILISSYNRIIWSLASYTEVRSCQSPTHQWATTFDVENADTIIHTCHCGSLEICAVV
jgi:hypothetical protein